MKRTTGTWAWTLFALFALHGGSAGAQTATAPVDPWDLPPLYCHNPTGPKLRVCQLKLAGGFAEEHLRSYGMYGQFDQLERSLRKLADSKEYFMTRRLKGSAVYLALNEFADAQRTLGNTPKGQILAKWKKAVPDSEFVLLAEAMVLYGQAWEARGDGYSSTVSAQGREIFDQKMGAAEQMLLAAPPRLKETAAWNSLLLRIALEGRSVQSKWPDVLQAALERWPTYIGFYETTVWHIGPRWGGSWEAVEAFIEQATRRVAASEGRSYYARLYSVFGDVLVTESPRLDWAKLKPALDDWIEREPTPYALNRYATFACFARDKEAYRAHMEKVAAEEIYAAPWLQGYTYESCSLWASR